MDTVGLPWVDEGDVRHVCDSDARASVQPLIAPVDERSVGARVREEDAVPLAFDGEVVATHDVDADFVLGNATPDDDLWAGQTWCL